MTDERAIGVFDSGLGGLSILSALQSILPHESMVYLGDTARLPYGTKSARTLESYVLNNAQFLLSYTPLKLLIMACHTATAIAFHKLSAAVRIPVIGVIEPTVQAVMRKPSIGSVGILGTSRTIQSQAFQKAFLTQGFGGALYPQACPLFVALVEEGHIEGPIAQTVVNHYAACMPTHLDVIILGCTHFPPLTPLLQSALNPVHGFIDSAQEVACCVREFLTTHNLAASQNQLGKRHYLVTDAPVQFEQLSRLFLGYTPPTTQIEIVDIGLSP